MKNYQHILAAIDFNHTDVIERAKQLAQYYQAQLSVIHVLDNIPMPDTPYGTIISLKEVTTHSLLEAEKQKFITIMQTYQLELASCHLIWGIPKQEIIQFAQQHNTDLIIIGTHTRHGLSLLLSSTADSIFHHAACDILAVHH